MCGTEGQSECQALLRSTGSILQRGAGGSAVGSAQGTGGKVNWTNNTVIKRPDHQNKGRKVSVIKLNPSINDKLEKRGVLNPQSLSYNPTLGGYKAPGESLRSNQARLSLTAWAARVAAMKTFQ